MFKFEKLGVWQKAVDFADAIYTHSSAFPSDERFGLVDQIRRAANSISSNVAEGSARSDPDFARFLGYAAGSLYEVVTQMHIARRRNFLTADAFSSLYAHAEEIARMLSGLRGSITE
jgi:four helix bundle protein